MPQYTKRPLYDAVQPDISQVARGGVSGWAFTNILFANPGLNAPALTVQNPTAPTMSPTLNAPALTVQNPTAPTMSPTLNAPSLAWT